MLNISFKRNSLLYGESCFLIAYLLFIPYFFWPDLAATKTKHLLLMTKTRRLFLKSIIRLWDFFLVRFFVVGFIFCTQIPYALILVTMGSLVQKDPLIVLVGLDEDGLAYKALYYAPILYRLGTFLMILMALWNRKDYRAWPTLDHFEVFSVNRTSQLHIILLCALIIIPDIMCSWVDTMLMLTYLRSPRHKWFQFTRANKLTNAAFILVASGVNTTGCIIRYKPFVSILYSALCVRKHMRLLKSQLFMSFSRADSSTANLLMSRLSGQAKSRPPAHDKQAPFEVGARHRKFLGRLLPRPKASAGAQEHRLEAGRVASQQQNQIDLFIDIKMSASRKQSNIVEVSHGEMIMGSFDDPPGWHDDPLCEIHNLFEFEKHLTQIHLFVASMDRCSPAGLFVLTFFNIVAFFYAYLYNRAIPSEYANLTLASLFLTSRILPVCILFIAGHLMELECRKIANLIEIIYLENSSHSLLYRHLKDSQHSLARIFRLLSCIKFDGDGLMAINLDSLKRLLFYVSSAIFIVIQYDSLLTIEGSAAQAPSGTDRANVSQYQATISLT